ncbi:hypothetical protein ACA910_013461 [Epithemia clementina (nom. ined.)]
MEHPGQPAAFHNDLGSKMSNRNEDVEYVSSSAHDRSPFVLAYIEGVGDDARVTEGLADLLQLYCVSMNGSSKTNRLAICCSTAATSRSLTCLCHIQQNDKFSCGFRNTQMVLSALCHWLPLNHPYHKMRGQVSPHYQQTSALENGVFAIPSLRVLQQTMEAAWESGLDPEGARHYSRRIVDKQKWIGAAEVWSLFAFWKTDACLVQFIKCSESRRLLGPFCGAYFSPTNNSQCLLCSRETTTSRAFVQQLLNRAELAGRSDTESSGVASPCSATSCNCPILPLYLQWQGHSVTIIGVESDTNGTPNKLMVLDPLASGEKYRENWAVTRPSKHTKRGTTGFLPLSKLENKDCQIIVVSPRASNHIVMNAATAAPMAVHIALYRLSRRHFECQHHQVRFVPSVQPAPQIPLPFPISLL